MMVETVLESSQDFGMSSGSLPQWKRELLQRRALRARPPAPAPPPPPPPPPAPPDDDEELRYGPGIVKRLKSRYLSLALRDAPRRRPSVLRRATSLEHLLDEPAAPPERAPRPPRPASLAVPPPPPHRRDLVKRARSVDALSRLEAREEPQPLPSPPRERAPPPPRMPRPPRRPPPLLRDAERPPPDLVRSTLRKFEPTAARRPQPAPRVSAALRALDARPRTSTPEPRARSPSPAAADLSAIEEGAAPSSSIRPVSRAALEGIARAGSTTRYSFEAARRGSHLPPLAATNPVLVGRARRVGVIRPMPAPQLERAASAPDTPPAEPVDKRVEESPPRIEELPNSPTSITSPVADIPPATPPPPVPIEAEEDRWEPPSAIVEPIPRPSPDAANKAIIPDEEPTAKIDVVAEKEPDVVSSKLESEAKCDPITKPEPPSKPEPAPRPEISVKPETVVKCESVSRRSPPPAPVNGQCGVRPAAGWVESRIGAALVERPAARGEGGKPAWARGPSRPRGPQQATSVVFNFSDRKEVPDYIENDGLILRSSRRDRIKPGEPGVVVLVPELALSVADSDSDETDCGPPSPCAVRFVNDNVLINGRSSMPAKPDRTRHARLKLQFDDSLTRTFEYPSETSLCEDVGDAGIGGGDGPCAPSGPSGVPPRGNNSPPPPTNGDAPQAHPVHRPHLLANTHMVSSSLSRYTPSKTCAAEFQLGVTRTHHAPAHPAATSPDDSADKDGGVDPEEPKENGTTNGECSEGGCESGGEEAAPWWRHAAKGNHPTDLLF